MAYATLDDLRKETGETRTGDERRLERASELLDAALISAVYDTDANEDPTDPTLADAFLRAVCAQVEWWRETGDELGQATRIQAATLGPASIVRAQLDTPGRDRLCPRAVEIIRTSGIWRKPYGY